MLFFAGHMQFFKYKFSQYFFALSQKHYIWKFWLGFP